MKLNCSVIEGLDLIDNGGIIAYPTEAVFGLGCDPFNEKAVTRLLKLKKRPIDKGLIILISNWKQLYPLIHANIDLSKVKASWPGHITWLFQKSPNIPYWISGQHDTVAIRMTNHPVAKALCSNGPIVSTSANISDEQPALNHSQLLDQFSTGISAIVAGELGPHSKPSDIYDVSTGKKMR